MSHRRRCVECGRRIGFGPQAAEHARQKHGWRHWTIDDEGFGNYSVGPAEGDDVKECEALAQLGFLHVHRRSTRRVMRDGMIVLQNVVYVIVHPMIFPLLNELRPAAPDMPAGRFWRTVLKAALGRRVV